MNTGNLKNIVVLKDLPSNLVEEAIVVLKENQKIPKLEPASTDKKESKSVKIIPLGGLDKIGMNITAIEYEDTIVVVDCGIAFPEPSYAGYRQGDPGCFLPGEK